MSRGLGDVYKRQVAKRLKEEQLKTRLLLQVHDELLLEVPEDELEKAEQILEEEMTGAAHLAVKLEIDMHTGNNWYEAKECTHTRSERIQKNESFWNYRRRGRRKKRSAHVPWTEL